MPYEVKARIGIPVMEEREIMSGIFANVGTGDTDYKEIGDTVTKAELLEAGQTEEDIEKLIADGALEATHES